MIHLVLDHSALIPCSSKPEDEKKAIAYLSDKLMNVNATWYISTEYLKTLYTVLIREGKQCCPLPKLQRDLLNKCIQILKSSRSRSRWCKPIPWRIRGYGSIESHKLRIHIVGRHVSNILKQYNVLLHGVPELQNLSDDDREVLALAFKASSMVNETIYVATTDTLLLDTINRVLDIANELRDRVAENLKRLKPLTPSQLLQEVIRIKIIEDIEEVEKKFKQELEVEFPSRRQQITF